MDKLDPSRRSENMRRIKSKNTKPEVLLRSLLHRKGYRFRIHRKDIPGNPDIVFPGRRKAIFVHGCFWHQHQACREGRLPGTRQDYWVPKLEKNKARDALALERLTALGWQSAVVWECELCDLPAVVQALVNFLDSPA
jgi:DNA mismatch endonuclease (patch repair protein)